MTYLDPAAAAAALAATGSFGTVGTDIFKGREIPSDVKIPVKCIFFFASGGPPPQGYINGRASAFTQSDVQIIVRGVVDSEKATRDIARALIEHFVENVPTGFIHAFVFESEPNDIGMNDAKQPRFTVNLRLQATQ